MVTLYHKVLLLHCNSSYHLDLNNLISTYCYFTPSTVKSCNSIVTLDRLSTAVTFAGAVAFYPMVVHDLQSEGSKKQNNVNNKIYHH